MTLKNLDILTTSVYVSLSIGMPSALGMGMLQRRSPPRATGAGADQGWPGLWLAVWAQIPALLESRAEASAFRFQGLSNSSLRVPQSSWPAVSLRPGTLQGSQRSSLYQQVSVQMRRTGEPLVSFTRGRFSAHQFHSIHPGGSPTTVQGWGPGGRTLLMDSLASRTGLATARHLWVAPGSMLTVKAIIFQRTSENAQAGLTACFWEVDKGLRMWTGLGLNSASYPGT